MLTAKAVGFQTIKNMKKLLSEIYKELGIQFKFPILIKNNQGNATYSENSKGYWGRWEYDEHGKPTYFKSSDGYWWRRKYDKGGNEIYYENSSYGYWRRGEYDEQGKETYYENSEGTIRGTPRKSCADGKVVVIEGQKYKLNKL